MEDSTENELKTFWRGVSWRLVSEKLDDQIHSDYGLALEPDHKECIRRAFELGFSMGWEQRENKYGTNHPKKAV